MNEETISQEQYLFNQLNFEERKNIIEIMEYIINLQQENNQLKDKIKGIQEERDYLFNKLSIENKYLSQENNQLAEKVINQRHALCDTNKKIQVLNARIEKAFKYIDYYVRIDDEHYETLKEILKGEENK